MGLTIGPKVPGVYVGNSSAAGRGGLLEVTDPSSGALLTHVEAGSAIDVERAVEAAVEAGPRWAALTPAGRATLLTACAELLRSGVDELVEVDVRDAGLPRSLARRDAEAAARYFEFYAGLTDKLHGDTIPLGAGRLDYTLREPWGVCGIVLPFNVPLQVAARDLAPALAMGNAVVAKPGEQAPLPALALVQRCWEAGLPPGVLNAVVGDGAVGEALVRHNGVDHVTFTGSQQSGRRVMAGCAETLKPSTIELGGKSPHLLFEDGSVEDAVAAIVGTTFRTAGQACSAGTRLLVHRSRHDEARDALVEAVGRLTIGPADNDPDIGPLITSRQRDAVVGAIREGVAAGARAVAGGGIPAASGCESGYFVEPTVLDDVPPTATIAREESFGPVLAILTFEDEQEAVALANDTSYGLVAGIWTRDISRAHRVAERMSAGQVFINNYGVGGGVELPFGGYKRSGIGRVKGVAGALEYTQLKNVCVAFG